MLVAYGAHLTLERGLSPHTVRAYLTDLADLAEHARRGRTTDPAGLDLRTLRGWLANQQTRGRSRTTVARRATSVRVFTTWLAHTGRATSDAGALLASPKRQRPLPSALRADQMRAVLDAAAATATDDGPVGLRDVAALELLYATGIRVGELVGLDVDDIDHERHLVRVLGKGSKERSVPYGRPASAALVAWLDRGRPGLVTAGSGPALFARLPGRQDRPAHGPPDGAPAGGGRGRHPRSRPARAAPHRRDPPARGRRRPALGAGDARARLARDHAGLHPRQRRAAPHAPTGWPTPAPEPALPSAHRAGRSRSEVCTRRRISGQGRRTASGERPEQGAEGQRGTTPRPAAA